MRYAAGLAGACTLAFVVAGCGTKVLNSNNLENLIQTKMSAPPFDLNVKNVKCPTDRPVKKGDQFTCTMTLTNGETAKFKVTQVDNNSNVHVQLAQEIPTYVEHTITSNLAAQGVRATASCPPHVAVVVGATFTCTLVDVKGQHGTAQLTIRDTSGGFRITALHSG
jgi:Domain of unknown function (DUF4333)